MHVKNTPNEEEGLLSQLLFKLLPYWPLFLFFSLISLAGAYVYLRYTNPVYKITATLIIKDEKRGSDDSKMLESLDMLYTKKIVENEVEVLKSYTLIDTVIKALDLYAPIFEEGKITATSAYITSPVIIKARFPDDLESTEKIYIRYDKNKGAVWVNTQQSYRLNEWVKTPYGNLRFELNKKYKPGEAGKLFYFILSSPRKTASDLLSNLMVDPSGKLSTVVYLSYKDEMPRRGEDILNELIKSYNSAGINDKNNLAKNTLAFVEERLNVVGRDLDSIERKIQRYKSTKGVVNISTQGQLFLENVSANDQKLNGINMQLAVLDQVEKFVSSKNNSGGIMPSTLGINDPDLSQLLDRLYASELQAEKLKNTVAENNPLMISVNEEIKKVRPSILENIESQKRSLSVSKSSLNSNNQRYSSMLHSIPVQERELLDISREQSIKNSIYSFLLQKREEGALSFSSTVSDTRVVDNAQSSILPVSPNHKIVYAGAILTALFFFAAIIMIKELFSGKILYRKDLEKMCAFPVLGEVAFQKGREPLVIKKGQRTFIAEEFRKLRTSLTFLGIGNLRKKILVTSSIPGEGKSFIAANLAVSLALTEKKVVLVDLDLNNPSLNKLFDMQQEVGVTEFLRGERVPEEIIKTLDNYPDLYFVPAGALPENPSEMLSNGRIKTLITYLENNYDYVVIDSSPVVPVSDTYLLSAYCDATLYVLRHKYTPKNIIRRINENNKINSLTNPAIVFNGVKPRGLFHKNYGYGYGYGYVYNYSQHHKKEKKSVV